jgi:endoglucanase
MNVLRYFSILLMMTLWCVACGRQDKLAEPVVLYNQVGYMVDGPKMILVSPDVSEVIVKEISGREVLRASAGTSNYWSLSGDSVRKVDLSGIDIPGRYHLVMNGVEREIEVLNRPFTGVARAAVKAFYYNRSGMAVDSVFGGSWVRLAGHPDTTVYVHASAADANRPEGTVISSPMGWYDAGDYNKYIVNSGISTYTLLRALQDFPDYFDQLRIGLPDADSVYPDLLTETLYNLKWVLTMQDPNDGGVYHKLTTKKFEDFIMPHEAIKKRFVVSKSTSASLDFAALAAHSAGILCCYEGLSEMGEVALIKAVKAYDWALKNSESFYFQPGNINTGAYDDDVLTDEWFWASAELFLATGDQKYLEAAKVYYQRPSVPSWNKVDALGVLSLLDVDFLSNDVWIQQLKTDFLALVDELVEVSKTSPYGISLSAFEWGSNSSVANEAMLKLFACKLTGNNDYWHSALSDIDYLLGRNATGYCFVTGFGDQKVMNIHHRPSIADGVVEPVPGFLVGGPNTVVFADCPNANRSLFPAKSYVDLACSYSTNEIAINWNAPFVYLAGGLDALMIQ